MVLPKPRRPSKDQRRHSGGLRSTQCVTAERRSKKFSQMKRQKVLWIPRAVSIVLALSAAASAQFTPAPGISMRAEDRISLAVDDSRRASLLGNVSPRINSGTDLGPVAPSFELPYVTLVLTPSAGQQADLDRLLTQQQDSSSPDYHRWLTPEQYAERFGVSQSDIDKVVSWLEANMVLPSSP